MKILLQVFPNAKITSNPQHLHAGKVSSGDSTEVLTQHQSTSQHTAKDMSTPKPTFIDTPISDSMPNHAQPMAATSKVAQLPPSHMAVLTDTEATPCTHLDGGHPTPDAERLPHSLRTDTPAMTSSQLGSQLLTHMQPAMPHHVAVAGLLPTPLQPEAQRTVDQPPLSTVSAAQQQPAAVLREACDWKGQVQTQPAQSVSPDAKTSAVVRFSSVDITPEAKAAQVSVAEPDQAAKVQVRPLAISPQNSADSVSSKDESMGTAEAAIKRSKEHTEFRPASTKAASWPVGQAPQQPAQCALSSSAAPDELPAIQTDTASEPGISGDASDIVSSQDGQADAQQLPPSGNVANMYRTPQHAHKTFKDRRKRPGFAQCSWQKVGRTWKRKKPCHAITSGQSE